MFINYIKSLFIPLSTVIFISVMGISASAQEGVVDHSKLFKEVAGEYEFELPNGAKIIIKVYTEKGKLFVIPETENVPGEAKMVDKDQLLFQVVIPDGDTPQIRFIRNKENDIYKSILITNGMELTGMKIEKKDSKVDQSTLFKQIAGEYSFAISYNSSIKINFFVKDGKLFGLPETELTPGELQVLDSNALTFKNIKANGSENLFQFIKNTDKNISKFILKTPENGEFVGVKIIK